MREVGGRTVGITDPKFKRRKDHYLSDRELIEALQKRFIRRVMPEITKVHQFKVTRMERYVVSCYDAEDGGHFSAHRDNTTKGTAHRRFAVSVNLNDDFDGARGLMAVRSISLNMAHAVSKHRRVVPWCSPARCCTGSAR